MKHELITLHGILNFQRDMGLTPDGKVGPKTMNAFGAYSDNVPKIGTKRVTFDLDEKLIPISYDSIRVRSNILESIGSVCTCMNVSGAQMTTSGGLRRIGANIKVGRSATSLHYVGRAFDLGAYTMLVDPDNDPFVAVRENDKFRIWARAEYGANVTLDATYVVGGRRKKDGKYKRKMVSGKFIDFTELAQSNGWSPIRPQVSARSTSGFKFAQVEAWHFQFEGGLENRRFGEELLELYDYDFLKTTNIWKKHAHKMWRARWKG